MAIPGLFVEYLVNGAIAFIWLYPMLRDDLIKIEAPFLPLVALGLYLVGMIVDFLAWAVTRPLKHKLRKLVHRKYVGMDAQETQSGTLRQAKIALYAPELAKELAMRSSRDRIARGSIINAILATIFLLPWWIGVPLIGLSVVLWGGFEKLSYTYELCAERAIDEKLQREAGKKGA